MKIIVFGASGFIGSHLSSFYSETEGVQIMQINRRQWENLKQVEEVIKNFEPDVCINAAGSANVSQSFEFPIEDFKSNVVFLEQLLEVINRSDTKCKVINLSSAAVYGNPDSLPILEQQSTLPISPYGFNKLSAELVMKKYYHSFGIPTCSARIFSSYGPGQRKLLLWDIYQKLKKNDQITLYGTGFESRDYIYISDLVNALNAIIANHPFDGSAINIASGKETTIKEIAQIIENKHANKVSISFSNSCRKGDPNNWKANVDQLTNLGFKSMVSIDEGIEHYHNWYLNK